MRILYVTSFALLLQQAPVLAQTTTDTLSNKKELQEVVISGVKATDKNPVTFTNLNKKDIERQNFGQDLPFLLNLTPSTVVSSDAGAGVGYTGIRIRGTDPSRTNVTVNGVPINDAESHGMFWVNMPDFASSSQSIQVQRGVGTSTNGAGAFGASINVQTDGLNPTAYGEISNGYGSFNTWKHTVKAGTGLLENKWAFDARLSKITSDGFIDRAGSDLKSFFVSAAHYGKKSLLKFNVFSGVEKTYQAWNGIPEARLKGDVQGMDDLAGNTGMSQADLDHMLASGNRTYNQYTYSNQTDNYQTDNYQLFYTYQFSKYTKANIGLHYTYGRGYYEEFRKNDEFTTYKLQDSIMVDGNAVKSGDFVRRRWLDNDFYGTVFSFVYEKDKLNMTVGGGLNRYDGRHFGELIWAQYALGSSINDHFYDGKSTKTDVSFYGKSSYQLTPKLVGFIDLQGRKISYTLSGQDLNSGTYLPYDFNLTYNFFNPKAGLTYTIGADADVYGYVGVANKEPVRNDIIQASTSSIPKSERLVNYELGYRKSWKKSAVSVNFYYMDYKDQLVATGKVNDVGTYNRVNVASSYRAGIELAGGLQLLQKLRWQATLTYSQNKIKAFTEYLDDWDNGGQQTIAHNNMAIAYSPNIIGSSMFSYNVMKGVNIDVISKYVGKQYLDNTENENRKLNAFFVNDVRLGYEFKVNKLFNAVRLGIQVNNVFNVKYEPNGYTYSGSMGGTRYDFNYFYPQAGTNFLTNLTLKF
ncbi:MAG: TonB-dependent receptor [Bacteroidota bacterium]